MRSLGAVLGLLCMTTLVMASPQRSKARGRSAAPPPPVKSTTEQCAAELGAGVKTGLRFCDVILGGKPADSITVLLPPHRGTAKLQFDLHTRVGVPPDLSQTAQVFARNTAVIAVVGPKGEIVRAAVDREFRTAADLFDRIAGGAGGGPKTVAPGMPVSVEATIPAGVTSVGIVGVRLEVLTRLGKQVYDTPGRPIAIVSDVHAEYTPLK